MDFLTLMKILVRRWYVVVPTIVLSLVVGTSMVSSVEAQYEANGSVLLLGPREHQRLPNADPTVPPLLRNPYTEFSPSLTTTAAALELILDNDAHRRAIKEAGLSDEYEVLATEDSPTLDVTVQAASSAVAVETLETIFSTLSQELQERQAAVGAPPELQITSQPLVLPDRAAETTVARDRALAAFSVLGLLATISVALVTDSIIGNRRRRADQALLRDTEAALEEERTVPVLGLPEELVGAKRTSRTRASGGTTSGGGSA